MQHNITIFGFIFLITCDFNLPNEREVVRSLRTTIEIELTKTRTWNRMFGSAWRFCWANDKVATSNIIWDMLVNTRYDLQVLNYLTEAHCSWNSSFFFNYPQIWCHWHPYITMHLYQTRDNTSMSSFITKTSRELNYLSYSTFCLTTTCNL